MFPQLTYESCSERIINTTPVAHNKIATYNTSHTATNIGFELNSFESACSSDSKQDSLFSSNPFVSFSSSKGGFCGYYNFNTKFHFYLFPLCCFNLFSFTYLRGCFHHKDSFYKLHSE